MIVFDITNWESYDNVWTWINSLSEHADPNICKVLVGNKIDLEDQWKVTRIEARKLATDNEMQYFETSAKENKNVKELITHIMTAVYENIIGQEGEGDDETDRPSKLGQTSGK